MPCANLPFPRKSLTTTVSVYLREQRRSGHVRRRKTFWCTFVSSRGVCVPTRSAPVCARGRTKQVYADPAGSDIGLDEGGGSREANGGGGVVWYPCTAFDVSDPPNVFVAWRYVHLVWGWGNLDAENTAFDTKYKAVMRTVCLPLGSQEWFRECMGDAQ